MRRRRREQPLRFEFAPPPAAATPPPKPRRRRIRWLRLNLVFALMVLLSLVSAFFGFMTAVAQDLPNLDQFAKAQPAEQLGAIYAKNGYDAKGNPRWVKIATLASPTARILVTGKGISQDMKNAIVSIEDERFYQHRGVDPEGIGRALVKHFTSASQEGASTITQQFVKNTLTGDEHSLRRKVREAALAYQLEERWSKDKILAEYLNTINFGHGAYGVESAARFYFGKKASELGPGEAALLAAIPKSPTRFDPITNPGDARERRNTVLDKMVELKYLSAAAGEIEKRSSLLPRGRDPKHERGVTIQPYFVDFIKQQLVNRFGTEKTFGGGLKVYTTLDLKEQAVAEKAVRDTTKRTTLTGSLVSIEPKSGKVTAMVGGSDYKKLSFNIASAGHRQPGSSFKPFVLLAGLKKGIQTSTRFISKKQIFNLGEGSQPWVVTNDTNSYLGSISLKDAVKYSDNTVFSQLTMAVGPSAVADMAHRMGVLSPLDEGVPAIGLGGLRYGVSPLEMAHAYATLANEGVRIGGSVLFNSPESQYTDPSYYAISIEKVVFPTGRPLVNAPKSVRVVDQVDAQSAIDAMRAVLTGGTGKRANIGRPAAGKTGTTTSNIDAWFVGFTPQRATATWVGNPKIWYPMERDYNGKSVTGGTFPAEMWKRFMTPVMKPLPVEDWAYSAGRSSVAMQIDVRTWKPSLYGCPGSRELVVSADKAPSGNAACQRNIFIVPDLTGKTKAGVLKIAEVAGLNIRFDLKPAGLGDTPGKVIEQDPRPLTWVGVEDLVTVEMAVPVTRIVVPDVTSTKSQPLSLEKAVARLRAQRFRVRIAESADTDSKLPDGTVVGQSPAAGSAQPASTVITLTVIGTPKGVTVPKLIGLRLEEAEARLAALGLQATARREVGVAAAAGDVVYRVDPTAGSIVPDSSTVLLLTQRGRAGLES